MIERDMEDLIAAYPDDFFPQKQFVLVGRQQSLAGVGRFDLLFEDRFKSKILMELKARTLKYGDATQVANYRDELRRNGGKNVIMWLVATQIPHSVREFLDDKGIEYSEIHVAEFQRVAERHDVFIRRERELAKSQEPVTRSRKAPPAIGPRATGGLTSVPIPQVAEHLGAEWTVRDLAGVLGVVKSNALRRLKKWLASGKVEKISSGKRGRLGNLARYKFVPSVQLVKEDYKEDNGMLGLKRNIAEFELRVAAMMRAIREKHSRSPDAQLPEIVDTNPEIRREAIRRIMEEDSTNRW